MTDRKQHWEKVYETKSDNEVSWYQDVPETSLRLICSVAKDSDRIIDVGGGNSHLTAQLAQKGYGNLSVLDISESALERSREKAQEAAQRIDYIASDVLDFKPNVPFQVWHDRATFHFLTQQEEVNRYVECVQQAIAPSGHLIIGSFSTQGPYKCSGLDITQYSRESMNNVFSKYFSEVEVLEEEHTTPFNTVQHFLFMVFRRN